MFIEAKNEANINSSSGAYLIDLSIYGMNKSQNKLAKKNRVKLSRSQACSG